MKLNHSTSTLRRWLILVVLGFVVIVVVVVVVVAAADTISTSGTSTVSFSPLRPRGRRRRRARFNLLSNITGNKMRWQEEMLLVGEDDILPLQDDDASDDVDANQDFAIPRGSSSDSAVHQNSWWKELTPPNAPLSRRLHSAAVLQTKVKTSTKNNRNQEYMIISGGFTDDDRTTFPVYAFDMTAAQNSSSSSTDSTLWYYLGSSPSNTNDSTAIWPTGRVGHVSAVSSNNDLYVYGGSTYSKGKFHMADQYLWKATITTPFSPLQWEKIPLLHDNFPSRGETAGGIWKASLKDEYFIIYGGLSDTQQQLQQTLGDVWAFHLTNHTLEQWFPWNNTIVVEEDFENPYSLYPTSRTAHAVTISSNKLYVHGGMTLITLAEVTTTWAAQPQTLQQWEMLDDLWIFDLESKSWSYRDLEPRIARSYHTIISKNETIVSCGGYRMEESLAGELLKFSFADVLLSFPNNPYWYTAVAPPSSTANENNYNHNFQDLPHRYQHSAIVDTYGSMYVWGGRFRTVSEIKPTVWRLDVLDSMGNVAPFILMERASNMDSMDGYNAELETLHLMVAVLIVTSILFTTLFSSLRRSATDQEASMNVPTGVVVTSFGILHLGGDPNLSNSINRRGGVSQDILDALPVKTYCQGSTNLQRTFSSHDTNNTNNCTQENDSSRDGNDDEPPCCLICLVDYENGDEVRTLPCGHDFHKECVDSWLYNHSSCPACRSSIDRSVLLSTDEAQHSHVAASDDQTPWTAWSNLARAIFTNRITPFRRIEEEAEENSAANTSTHQHTSATTSSAVVEDAGINSLHLQVIDGSVNSNFNTRIDDSNSNEESDLNRTGHNNVVDWRLSSSSRARRLLLSTRHSRRGRRRRRALELVASYSTSSLIEEGDQAPNVIV